MNLPKWKIIQLPKIIDERGQLSFVEGNRHIPFEIKRIYYLYNIAENAMRGAHGHKHLSQLMIPFGGSFEITLDNGAIKEKFILNNPWEGLYIPPLTWRELSNFSSGAVCLVLASDYYDELDYFRAYPDFLSYVTQKENV